MNPAQRVQRRDLTRVNAASFGSSNSFEDPKKSSKTKGAKTAATFNEIGLVAEKAGLYPEGAVLPVFAKPYNTIPFKCTTVARTAPRTTARQRRPSLTPRPRPTPAFFIAAAAAYKRAIVEEPWNPVAHGNLGNALSELGLEALQECIDEYHTAVMLALARPDKNLKKSNARLASEYLVNLALTLLHVPSTVKRHHPRVAAEPDRVDEALAALKHAMHLCPKDAAIKFMFVGVGSVLVGVVEDKRMISIGLKGLGCVSARLRVYAHLLAGQHSTITACYTFARRFFLSPPYHAFHRYEDSLKELELELETVPLRSSRA